VLKELESPIGFINISSDNITPELFYSDELKHDEDGWITLANSVQLRLLEIGVLEVRVDNSKQNIVMSCGIHGNETAPIEIISRLISQIVNQEIQPKVNLLFILGNPESMKIPDRFVSINMNRLFAGAYKNYELNDKDRYELKRAESLEELVTQFFESDVDNRRLHLDLHTAIKPSFHKTFAIRPHCQSKISVESKELLLALGIEAVLQHNKTSTTFSYFSANKFNAEAYTLELGKVKKFGENNPDDFAMAEQCLSSLITGKENIKKQHSDLIQYKVVAEIIKHSEAFIFHLADNVENFTAFKQGSLIAEDANYNYRVAYSEEAVVFPNVNVPIGQRVAVMVTKV
jgi:succinylglutamate desuccinylase